LLRKSALDSHLPLGAIACRESICVRAQEGSASLVIDGPCAAKENNTDMKPDTLLTTPEVAERLRVSTSFLAKARVSGQGPRFIKVGRACRYQVSDLETYERSCARTSTGER
jgi:hypothetical protein